MGADALAAGGKRLRPTLTFLSSPIGAEPPVVQGAAVELVHMATLIHDDIVDGAHVRRGRAAAWTQHGSDAAKAAGDHLFAAAFAMLAATGSDEQVGALADASLALARGEAMQRLQRHDPSTTVDAYLERCALKTGSLFAAACVLGGGDGEFGRLVGIAFQIVDDVLDCSGETVETGKIPAPTCVTGRRRCRSSSPRARTRSSARALTGGPLEGAWSGSRRPVRSSARARSRSTTLRGRARASTAPPAARSSKRSPTPSSSGTDDDHDHTRRPLIRLGRISYVNMAPVFHRLTYESKRSPASRPSSTGCSSPARSTSRRSPRSSTRATPPRLRLMPRLCVSSEGAVDSIQLVTRMPLGHVRTVAVTPESATSVVLTKVLIPQAELLPLTAADEADAKLLIGDAALKSAFEDPTPHHDLGRLWLERTGLPMVFAVWAAPEPVVDGLADLQDALVASVRLARSEPERLAYEASERYGYPPGFLARYFEKLRYSFGPRERAGFYTFLEMARDVGELAQVPELRFLPTEPARVSG